MSTVQVFLSFLAKGTDLSTSYLLSWFQKASLTSLNSENASRGGKSLRADLLLSWFQKSLCLTVRMLLEEGGWSGGAKLGKHPVPGRPTILITVGQGPIALAVGAGGGCLDIFTLTYPFSSLSPSLWETAQYRLKYCLKGPLNPKQPTNQPRGRKFIKSNPD